MCKAKFKFAPLLLFSAAFLAGCAASRPGKNAAEAAQKSGLFLAKEWLHDLKPEIRHKFLGELLIKNSHVVSANVRYLEENLPEERANEIHETFGRYSDFEKKFMMKPKKTKSPIIKLSDLLEGVPQKAKNSFLDNIIFKNGAIAGVRTKELEKAIPPAEVNKILSALAAPEAGNPAMKEPSEKALCGNGVCKYAVCRGGNVPTGCYPDENENNACYNWCRNDD